MKETPTLPEGYEEMRIGSLTQVIPEDALAWHDAYRKWITLEAGQTIKPGFYYAVKKSEPTRSEEVPSLSDYAAPATKSVLEEAHDLVNGDRQASYGDASESFERIADFWHAYLKTKLKDTEHINAKDVASMMILMKVSRSVTSSKRDNWVDIAGYAELGSKLED